MKKNLIPVFLLLVSGTLAASTQGHGHGIDWNSVIARVLNSTILFGGLYFLLRKPVIRYFRQRSREIRDDYREREARLKKLLEKHGELQKKVDQMDRFLKEKKGEQEEKGRLVVHRIEESTRKEMGRISERFTRNLEDQRSLIMKGLMERLADRILQEFQEDIRKEMTKDLHQKIIRENIQLLGDRFAQP